MKQTIVRSAKEQLLTSAIGLQFFILLAVGIVVCLTSGCGPSAEARKVRKVSISQPSSLAVALSPHQGDGKLDAEIRQVQEQVPKNNHPEVLLERLGWLFVKKARESFDPGFYKLAEHCALAIEATKAESLEALLLRGHVLHNLHKFKEAEPLARQLVAQRGLPFDFGLLSDVLMEQGKLDEAIEACQRMLDLRPDLHSYSRGAHLRWLKGDVRGAQELMRLARCDCQLAHRAAAEQLCALALDFQRDYPPALLLRGRLLLAQGRTAAAVESLQRAAALNPLPEYQWILSEALRSDGNTAEAEKIEKLLRQKGAVTDPRTYSFYLSTRHESTEEALRLGTAALGVRAAIF